MEDKIDWSKGDLPVFPPLPRILFKNLEEIVEKHKNRSLRRKIHDWLFGYC